MDQNGINLQPFRVLNCLHVYYMYLLNHNYPNKLYDPQRYIGWNYINMAHGLGIFHASFLRNNTILFGKCLYTICIFSVCAFLLGLHPSISGHTATHVPGLSAQETRWRRYYQQCIMMKKGCDISVSTSINTLPFFNLFSRNLIFLYQPLSTLFPF